MIQYDTYTDIRNRLLIVYNETTAVEHIQSRLKNEGWETLFTMDSTEALHITEREMPDLVILYLTESKADEYEILRRVGRSWQIPVILVGTPRGIHDKVKYLNLGADDYVTEPVSLEEIIAKARALLRRSKSLTSVPFTCGSLQIDFSARRVTVQGKEVRLTPTEFRLMHQLVLNTGKVLTHSYLLSRVWGNEYGQSREYLHVFINRLRAKTEINPKNPRHIITVPAIGYRFQRED